MKTMTSSHETLASPHPHWRRNRWVLWTGRILPGLLALIVLLAASGATYEAIMTVGDTKRYPPPGQLVDVGGHRLHLQRVLVSRCSRNSLQGRSLRWQKKMWANCFPESIQRRHLPTFTASLRANTDASSNAISICSALAR
jgi:hypothetical protein